METTTKTEQLAKMASLKKRITELPDSQIEERLTLRYQYAQIQSAMLTTSNFSNNNPNGNDTNDRNN